MVQIIGQGRVKPPSASQRLGMGLSRAAGGLIEHLSQQQQMNQSNQMINQENEAAKRLGLDLSGITDPKIRQEIFSSALKGRNLQDVELLKQQGKQRQQQEKMSYLSQFFGGGEPQGQEETQGMQGAGQGQMGQGGFDVSQLSDAQIAQVNSIDPNVGRALSHAKDVALREKRAEREFLATQEQRSPEKIREKQVTGAQATADIKYNQELQSAHKQHEIKTQTLNRLEELNKKGVTGKPYEKLLEKFGLVNLTSEGRREFSAETKNLITDIRSILGSQFSQFEFGVILNAYPNSDFSQGANEAIIKNLKEFQDIRNQEFKIAKDLKKENGGKVPEDFQSKVNDRLQEYAQSKLPSIKANSQEIMREQLGLPIGFTVLLAPDGEPLGVPNDKVDELISMGAQMP